MSTNHFHPAPSADQQMLLDLVSGFSRDELAKQAESIDHAGSLPEDLGGQLAEMGLFAIPVPEDAGGAGFDFVSYALALTELAKGSAATAFHIATQTSLYVEPVAKHGHASFGPVAMGEARGALAVGEAFGSWSSAHMALTADSGILNGSKSWVYGADAADWILVCAKEGDGLSFFAIEKSRAGVRVGESQNRLGLRTVSTSTIGFENVSFSEDDRVGEAGKGADILRSIRTRFDLAIAAIATGIMAEAREVAGQYATERKQFGRSIATFEAIRERLVTSEIGFTAALNMLVSAARMIDDGQCPQHLAAVARVQSSDAAMKATDDALQIYGGYGVSQEYPAERLYRDARCLAVLGGGNDAARQEIAARVLPES